MADPFEKGGGCWRPLAFARRLCTVAGPKSAAAISLATLPMRSPVICPESASMNLGGHHHERSMKRRRRAATVREPLGVCHHCQLPNGPGRSSALSQDKELENRVMQIIEIINPIFEFLRKLAVENDIGHCLFET